MVNYWLRAGRHPENPDGAPARLERRALPPLLFPRGPQVPAPGLDPRNRRLDQFQRPEAGPQPERRANRSLKRAPKGSPSIPGACGSGSGSESAGGDRAESSSRAAGGLSSPGPPSKRSVLNHTPTGPTRYELVFFTCMLTVKPPNNPVSKNLRHLWKAT
nr:uncharacterized protein LOC105099909 [Camelus dromedarius]